MNYERPQLLDQLAATYVLGLLRGRARARFERLCVTRPQVLASRQRWEDYFLPLALALAPIAPGADHWPAIERKLRSPAAERASSGKRVQRLPARRWWQAAAAAGVIAAALLVGKLTLWNEPAWQAMAVLAPAHAAPLWRVERSADSHRLIIHTVGTVQLAAARSYELWVLPAGGAHPVSLGLLPDRGNLERTLSAEQRRWLRGATQLAVSIEPAGGSPTGLPTGPVVIVAPISTVAGSAS
jgi:anti-sigma-K factor RskA